MSTFINSDVTNNGKILIAKGYLGQRINFTRIVMGDGYLPAGADIADLTDVVNAVVTVNITKKKLNKDGTVVIGGEFSNADIQTEFFYRELALFGEGEDGVEILYCYGNAGDFAERIMPVGGTSIIEKTIDIITTVGTAKNITANIVRETSADAVSYDDSDTKLGVQSVQEVVEILVRRSREQEAALSDHINNTDVHVTAGQIDNIFTALRELILHTENKDIHVTLKDKDYWNTGAIIAAEALALAKALALRLEDQESRIDRIEDSLFNDITGNPFSISFNNIDGIAIIKGIWNKELQRIEC